MDEITTAEDYLIDEFFEPELALLQGNQFIGSADERTVSAYEKKLGIAADPGLEPIEFRRERLLSRLSMRVPFTMRFLRNRMDAAIGKGRYSVDMDYGAYTLTVESSATNQNWNQEIRIMINRIKPANIVYRNIPLVFDELRVNESIKMVEYVWNYRAGTTARTSLTKPLGSLEAESEILGADRMTVQDALIDRVAGFTLAEIDNVLLNDSYVVPAGSFAKSEEDGRITVEYTVPVESGLDNVTNIKLRDAAGVALTNSPVYFNVTENVTVKHFMTVKEG
jgi:hypothetical protein